MTNPPRDSEGPDYEVGYGKPPKRTQFRKGRSGNPTGRRKGAKSLRTDLFEELGEKILVQEGGKPRRITKQRAVVKALLARTAKGDIRAMALLIATMREQEVSQLPTELDDAELEACVRRVLEEDPEEGETEGDREPPLDATGEEGD